MQHHFKAFIDYLQYQKKYSPHTVKAYEADLLSFAAFLELNKFNSVDLIDYSIIRTWIVELSESGMSNTSINRKMSSLKAYYKFLMRIEVISTHPLLKFKSLKQPKKVQVPFSSQEVDDVLQQFASSEDFEGVRDRAIVGLLFATGIRRAELISIRLDHLNLQERTLKVIGKRNKERIVPLIQEAVEFLECYLELRNNLELIIDKDNLFLSLNGVKLSQTFVYKIINSYFSIVSAKSKKSPHVLRHTFATQMLNSGADLNSVKELLGHSSLASTQVYTHNSLAELKKVYQNAHPRNKS
jgi:integrase/recombinase XerC